MSRAYKIKDPDGIYFVTFAVVGWIDVFTRECYSEILIDSFKYCQKEKGLRIHAWVIMSSHVHLVISTEVGKSLVDVIRDFKRHTSKEILRTIESHTSESRREWMLAIFKNSGAYNSNNTT